MAFRYKTEADHRKSTANLAARNRQHIAREAVREAACDEMARANLTNNMFNAAIRRHKQQCRRPLTAASRNNAQLIARAAAHIGTVPNHQISRASQDHRRLSRPGAYLIEGSATHHYYIGAEVNDVDNGTRHQFHYDYRHDSPFWIWDQATRAYVTRHVEAIDLTE